MAKGPMPMKMTLIILLCVGLLPHLYSTGRKQGVRRGYENPYKAHIANFVPIKENLLGQYKKAYTACERVLNTLPHNTQSLQVLSCWKNMIHALKSLNRYEKLEPLRSEFLARYPRNVSFLAGLDIEAIAPYGYWQDHCFYRGEPAEPFLPIFSKLQEDRQLLLRHLTDPRTLRAAEKVPDRELKRLYFINLRKVLLAGNYHLSPEELQYLSICTKILRNDPIKNAAVNIKIPEGGQIPRYNTAGNFHSVLLSLFANDKKFTFRDLKEYRLADGGYGWKNDITESSQLLLTAWGCEATQFLGRTMNDRSAIAEPEKTSFMLSNYLTARYGMIQKKKSVWNDNDAFLACAAGRLGNMTAIIRMYAERKKLSAFANIMIARALPENIEEYRIIRNELLTLKPDDAKTLAAYLVFLKEKMPEDPRIPDLQNVLRQTPFSLWKARALYGEKIRPPSPEKPAGLLIKADPENGKLELIADKDLHFLRIGLPEKLPAPHHGFRTFANETQSVHREIENGREYLLFCKLPKGKHVIQLPTFKQGTITAECYNF